MAGLPPLEATIPHVFPAVALVRAAGGELHRGVEDLPRQPLQRNDRHQRLEREGVAPLAAANRMLREVVPGLESTQLEGDSSSTVCLSTIADNTRPT